MRNPQSNLPPGFRFHPTDEELILHYLRKKVASAPLPVSIIAEVDIYKCDPWELPEKAAFGEKEWYFFSPRDRKYPNGARPNRAAASGYWKATGTDKTIVASLNGGGRGTGIGIGTSHESIGVKKALVFYKGRPPKGIKTNWIMHEYRLVDNTKPVKLKDSSMRLDDWVLCRIYKKSKFSIDATREVPAMGDQHDQEAHGTTYSKDSILPGMRSSPAHNQNALMPQKSMSFSNLLDAMDYSLLSNILSETNPAGVNGSNIAPDHFNSGNLEASSNYNSNSYLFQRQPQMNSSLAPPNMETRIKRERFSNIEGDVSVSPPSKKCSSNSSCNLANNYTFQQDMIPLSNNVLNQSFLAQQLLSGPHFRYQ